MLKFSVFSDGSPTETPNLAGAYLVGTDDVPIRADLTRKKGLISCKKRAAGPAALAVLWDVKGVGTILVETVRLMERDKPYVLTVELARGRLIRLQQKLEDWGMMEHEQAPEYEKMLDEARDQLIKAVQADAESEASHYGDESLSLAVKASEHIARAHGEALLARRRQTSGLPRRIFGATINLDRMSDAYRQRVLAACDFASLPIVWRDIEPTEQNFNFKPLDQWVEWLAKKRMPLKGSALLSFTEATVPDWLYIWEHDFETIRDLAYEHVKRVVGRYGQYVPVWDVVDGLHAQSCFTLNFEQIMELTRMAAAAAKQVAPRSMCLVGITAPWGEYYARNQRTIPPLLYADMVMQSGVAFDGFSVQFRFGAQRDGMLARDMFQISSMLDQFARLGRSLHVSAVQVPSRAPSDSNDGGSDPVRSGGGSWREPWNERVQAEWLKQFVGLALSKPYVDTVCWDKLADELEPPAPHGGLLADNLSPKPAYEALLELRTALGPRPTE